MPDFEDFKNPIIGRDFRSLSVQFENEQRNAERAHFGISRMARSASSSAPLFLPPTTRTAQILCFWDEPDNHLALSEVGHFVMDLRRSFQSGGQLVVTSHNQEAISRFSE